MIKLNNKGQSLILFILMFPVLILIFILVIDIGNVIVLKQELDNINNVVLDYGLDNLDMVDLDKKLDNLVKLNNNEIDSVNILIEEDKIYIKLVENIDGMFSQFIDFSIFNVKSSFVGYIYNNEKRIEKVMGD